MQEHAPMPQAEGSRGPSEETVPARTTVLLLEDEGDFREIVCSHLEINECRVTCVANGAEGLKRIMHEDFDVILCDMMMPTLPGDMFYLAVQRTRPHLCKRFIFMTGYRHDPKIDAFIRKIEGMVLWKPFPMQDLFDSIKLILDTTREGR